VQVNNDRDPAGGCYGKEERIPEESERPLSYRKINQSWLVLTSGIPEGDGVSQSKIDIARIQSTDVANPPMIGDVRVDYLKVRILDTVDSKSRHDGHPIQGWRKRAHDHDPIQNS